MVDYFSLPILYIRKLSQRKVIQLAQGHKEKLFIADQKFNTKQCGPRVCKLNHNLNCFLFLYLLILCALLTCLSGRFLNIFPFLCIKLNFVLPQCQLETHLLHHVSTHWSSSCCSVTKLCLILRDSVTHQTPLSVGFSRQEYWSGLPCPSPGDLPYPGIKPRSLSLLHWRAGSLLLAKYGKPCFSTCIIRYLKPSAMQHLYTYHSLTSS